MHSATQPGSAPERIGLRAKLLGCAGVLALICAISALTAGAAQASNPIVKFIAVPSTTQAGGHPDVETEVNFGHRLSTTDPSPCDCSDGKDLTVHLPTGFIGNPHAAPVCTFADFSTNTCPIGSQVGYTNLLIASFIPVRAPIYNMEPHPDEAGLIGFYIPILNGAAFITLSARTGSDYGLDATNKGAWHLLPVDVVNLNLWGVPAAPSHDEFRWPFNPQELCVAQPGEPCPAYGPVKSDAPESPFLENPTTCGVALTATADVVSYDGATTHAETEWPTTTGCEQLAFNPSLTAQPTTTGADSASGLDVDLSVPQLQSPTVPSPSELRATTLTLPDGFTINPNAADGKTSCSEAQASFGTELAAQCPENAKVGTLEIDSSALPAPLPGAIYLGEPQPGNKYRLFLAADGFGTHVKLAGSVHPSPQTGQLVVTFKDQPGQGEPTGLPQTPLQDFRFHFFGSERGLLATPTQCGSYPVKTEFEPWDAVLQNQTSFSSFSITSGPNGGACPGAARPFNPSLVAGGSDNTAGVHSPFTLLLSRADGDQNLAALNVTTPPGFAATLKGIPYCPESALAKLAQLGYSGLAEMASPACPAASQIGTAVAGTGAGTHPLYSPGSVYLAGPYKGAPLSLEVVVPAVSGPYDLGNVVVRSAIFVNPATAQVSTVSDPITEILDGIPLRIRTIRINLDRPDFTLNPTNCNQFQVSAQVFGNQGGTANPAAPFQVANCAALGFAPKLSLKMTGSTKRRGHPSLRAVLQSKPGEVNLKEVVTALPKGELVDNAHIGTVCTRVQFSQGSCPAGSLMGNATVVTPLLDQPLEGPVYLRSSKHELPDLALDLHGQIHLEVVGRLDTPKGSGLRASFESIPDAPVSSIVLTTLGGKRGLLINSSNLCRSPQKAEVTMTGQNGAQMEGKKKLQTACGSKARHKRHAKRLYRSREVR